MMEENNFLAMAEFLQPITFLLVSVVGWGVKAVWNKVNSFDKKIDGLRLEIHNELQEYERKETCRAHREAIIDRIERIATLHDICLAKTDPHFKHDID